MSRITRAASLSIFCIWLLFKNLDNSFLSFEYLIYPNTPLRFDENFSRSSSVTYTFSDYLIRFCLFILYTYFYIKVKYTVNHEYPKQKKSAEKSVPFLFRVLMVYRVHSLLIIIEEFYLQTFLHSLLKISINRQPHLFLIHYRLSIIL